MPEVFHSPKPSVPPVPAAAQLKPASPIAQAFSAYLYMPGGMHFDTQNQEEIIILLLRKHWITNVPWILIGSILLITPILIFPLFLFSGSVPAIPANLIQFLILIWYLFTFSYIFLNFLLWYFTVSIVTNERVIDIDFANILNKRVSETRLSKIEDVSQHTGGFLRAFFNYGDVIVQTAGTNVEFEFLAIPRPQEVVRIINHLLGKDEEEGGGGH